MDTITPTVPVDARLAAAMAQSSGVASEWRLRQLGFSRKVLRSRVRRGILREVLPRTYAHVGVECLDDHQLATAARASLQHHHSALAMTTAARALRIWNRGRLDVVHVLSTTRWRPAERSWLHFHSTEQLPDDDVTIVEGHPTTSVVRTCLDLGTCLTEWQLTHVLYEAQFLYDLDLDELERRNARRPGFRGCAVVRAAIAHRRAGSTGTHSMSEDYLLEGILRAHLPIPMVCNVNATELRSIECDFVWHAERLIVEVDGRGHRRTGRRERDRGQVEQLEAAGWRVIRIETDRLWKDRQAVVAQIERVLFERRSCLINA